MLYIYIYKALRVILALFKVQMGRQEFKRNVPIEREREVLVRRMRVRF